MLTRKDLESATYPITLEGRSFRLGSKLILNQMPRFTGEDEFYGSSIHDTMITGDGRVIRAFDIQRVYNLWELGEQPYDANQNGDTDEDV